MTVKLRNPDDLPTPLADRLAREQLVDLQQWQRIALTERALAGDLPSAIEWLEQHAQNR
jgi:hypothetical protein